MRNLIDEKRPFCTFLLTDVHPDFPGGVPSPSGDFVRVGASSGYLQKRVKDNAKRYSQDMQTAMDNSLKFIDTYSKVVKKVEPLLTDYDKQIVLPTTCGLSFIKPSHSDFDARGTLRDGKDYTYPQELYDAVKKFYLSTKTRSQVDVSISLPRGRNSGWPLPISGGNRALSDVALAINVAISLGFKKAGSRLADATDFLSNYHGPAYLIPGERYQHSSRTMPMMAGSRWYFSKQIEPRVRTILMSGKYAVAWNKPFVNRVLADMLKSKPHAQQRGQISGRISAAIKKGWRLYAVDAKRFDGRHGGTRGQQIVSLIADVWSDSPSHALQVKKDLMDEMNLSVLQLSEKGAFLSKKTSTALLLPSGVSSTTIVNCAGNIMITVGVVSKIMGWSPTSTIERFGKEWDFLAWGDDGLIMVNRDISDAELTSAYKAFEFDAEFEPTVKFLGSNYAKGTFQGSMDLGYSVGRAVQQQFFPERMKVYPFTTIGYIARTLLMGDKGKEWHKHMLREWPVEQLGKPFEYNQFEERLALLIPEVQKHSEKISQLDDVLQMISHGIGPDISSSLDPVFEDFEDFFGLNSVDVTDPQKFLTEMKGVNSHFIGLIRDLQNGDLAAYRKILDSLGRDFGVRYLPGNPVY